MKNLTGQSALFFKFLRKHPLPILTSLVILIGLIAATILSLTSQDIRQRAAPPSGPAIYFSPDQATFAPNNPVTIDLMGKTQGNEVNGFQTIINLTGQVPSDITFAPNNISGLSNVAAIIEGSSSQRSLKVAFITSNPSQPFSGGPVRLGSLTFTAPQDGSFNATFDQTLTKINSQDTGANLIQNYQNASYSFQAPIQGAAIFFNPNQSSYTSGDSVSLNLMADTGGNPVNGFQAVVNFTGTVPSDITFTSSNISGLNNVAVTIEGSGSQRTLNLAMITSNPNQPFSSDQPISLGTLSFTAPNFGSLSATFDPTLTIINSPGNEDNLISNVQNASYSFSGGTGGTNPAPDQASSSFTPPTPENTNLTISEVRLINAATNTPIQTVGNTATLDLSQYPDFSVEAIRGSADVNSVSFVINGQPGLTESFVPFAIAGDPSGNGNYNSWNVGPGTYDIYMIPYDNRYQGGDVGVAKRLILTVTDGQTPTTNCTPSNQTITVSPSGSSGNCHDIQQALDAVPDNSPHHTINLLPGTYSSSDTLLIENKTGLTLNGLPDVNITGNPLRLLRVENSSDVIINNLNITNHLQQAELPIIAVSISNSTNTTIQNSTITAPKGVGIFATSSSQVKILNNRLMDSKNGVVSNHSHITITNNLITGHADSGLDLEESSYLDIGHNTISDNVAPDASNNRAGLAIFRFDQSVTVSGINIYNNIITGNKTGFYINDFDSALPFFTFRNDVWGNDTNFSGINSFTGVGHISSDPLFGEDYCLPTNSPAIYGQIDNDEFIGYRSFCDTTTPTPTPSPTPTPPIGGTSPTPTPNPTPTPTTPPTTTLLNSLRIVGKFIGVNKDIGPISALLKLGKQGQTNPVVSQTTVFTHQAGSDLYETTLTNLTGNPNLTLDTNYWLTIKGEKHLQRALSNQSLQADTNFNLVSTPFQPGDLPPQDGLIDNKDLSRALGIMTKPKPTITDLQTADLNYDGAVNSLDFGLILHTLSTKPDEIIQ